MNTKEKDEILRIIDIKIQTFVELAVPMHDCPVCNNEACFSAHDLGYIKGLEYVKELLVKEEKE